MFDQTTFVGAVSLRWARRVRPTVFPPLILLLQVSMSTAYTEWAGTWRWSRNSALLWIMVGPLLLHCPTTNRPETLVHYMGWYSWTFCGTCSELSAHRTHTLYTNTHIHALCWLCCSDPLSPSLPLSILPHQMRRWSWMTVSGRTSMSPPEPSRCSLGNFLSLSSHTDPSMTL